LFEVVAQVLNEMTRLTLGCGEGMELILSSFECKGTYRNKIKKKNQTAIMKNKEGKFVYLEM
jgi:hypothetical protein